MKRALKVFTFSMMISTMAFAKGGDMGGGRSRHVKLFSITTSEVEAFMAKDGTYTKISDLQEGLEKLNGVFVTPKRTLLDLSTTGKLGLETLILRNGREIKLDVLKSSSGGDMGGG